MAVPTIAVTGHVKTPDGLSPTNGKIAIRLTTPGTALDGTEQVRIASEFTATVGALGAVSFNVVPNDAILPTGTSYLATYVCTLTSGKRVQWAETWQLTSSDPTIDIGSIPSRAYTLAAAMPAAAPQITPAAGTYAESQTVTITATSPGSTIYYTTNGATPTTASAVYSAPLTVAATATVKAISVAAGFQQSDVASVAYTINPLKFISGLPTIAVSSSTSYAYIRQAWDGTNDMVHRIALVTSTLVNDPVEEEGVRLVPVATLNSGLSAAWVAATGDNYLSLNGDDADPPVINGIRYGGNHGPLVALQVTKAAHGMTDPDVGSRWQDTATKKWTLVRIYDANTLWFMPDNIGTATVWNFPTSVTGTTMTHVSGATHTGSIAFTSPITAGPENILQHQTKTITKDGVVHAPGVASGISVIEVTDTYDLPNLSAALDYIKANVGSTPAKTLNDAAIQSQVRMTSVHRFTGDGGYTIQRSLYAYQEYSLSSPAAGLIGFTQSPVVNRNTSSMRWYMPRVTSWTGARLYTPTYLDDCTADFAEQLDITSARWASPTNPPDRMAQIVHNAGTVRFGFVMGIDRTLGVGVPAVRRTVTSLAAYLSTIRKMYPIVVDSTVGLVPAGTDYTGTMYRIHYPGPRLAAASVFGYYLAGGGPRVVLDFHANAAGQVVQLPTAWAGATVEVLDSSPGTTVDTPTVSGGGTITVSVTGGYGYLVLRLI